MPEKAIWGECRAQRAAEMGMMEWKEEWHGSDTDVGDPTARAIEALYEVGRIEGDAEEILLPPIDEQRLMKTSGKFKGATGLSHDWLRPRHVSKASRGARLALVRLLQAFERLRRWPELLRTVIEIAIPKKLGGSRLIGLATAIYRIWTKLRYQDLKFVMESRVSRRFLPAAPGQGAGRAAFDQTFEAECATAVGRHMATLTFDMKRFYEQVTLE